MPLRPPPPNSLHPLLDHKGTEKPGMVFLQCLWLLNALPTPSTLSWTHFSISEESTARSAPKKVPLQEDFEQRKFPSLVLRFPAFQLFGSQPGPCLHLSKPTALLVIIFPCFCVVLCTFQSIFMHALFDTHGHPGRMGKKESVEDNTSLPSHPTP